MRPQGGVLLGTAGYWPAGFDTTAVVATHGNVAVNTRLCAGCHVAPFTVTDATGNVTFQSTGHLFRPNPCLDASGTPTADTTCARPGDPGYVSGTRKWNGCAQSGCHSSETAAENAFEANRNIVRLLADALWVDANGNQVLYTTDPATGAANAFDPGDTGLLTQVPVTEFNPKDNLITDAEGVYFNVQLIGENRYGNGDRSFGAHNPFLAQSLLTASIDALKARYGLACHRRCRRSWTGSRRRTPGRAPVHDQPEVNELQARRPQPPPSSASPFGMIRLAAASPRPRHLPRLARGGAVAALLQAQDTLTGHFVDSVVVRSPLPDPLVPIVQWIFQKPSWLMAGGIVVGAPSSRSPRLSISGAAGGPSAHGWLRGSVAPSSLMAGALSARCCCSWWAPA